MSHAEIRLRALGIEEATSNGSGNPEEFVFILANDVLVLLAEVDRYREALDVAQEFFVYADKADEEWDPDVQDEKFEALRVALAAVGGDPEEERDGADEPGRSAEHS